MALVLVLVLAFLCIFFKTQEHQKSERLNEPEEHISSVEPRMYQAGSRNMEHFQDEAGIRQNEIRMREALPEQTGL